MHQPLRFLALAALFACGAAQAQFQGWTAKAGVIRYAPDSRTSGVTGVGIPAGADADVGAANTLLLAFEYDLGHDLGVELVLGVPPTIKATATGSVAFLGEVLSAKNVAPTLLFNYHFGSAGSMFRPYVGLGLNYTKFIDVKSPYGWEVDIEDSLGWAAHVGANLALGKDWGLFASYGRAKVKSDLVAVGATVIRTTIDFRPSTYTVGAYFSF